MLCRRIPKVALVTIHILILSYSKVWRQTAACLDDKSVGLVGVYEFPVLIAVQLLIDVQLVINLFVCNKSPCWSFLQMLEFGIAVEGQSKGTHPSELF